MLIKTLYAWIIAELNEHGYTEQDIVLVSDETQTQVLQPDEFKEITDVKHYAVSMPRQDRKEPLVIVVGQAMYIHLKDGSIATYTCQDDFGDWVEYKNILTLLKSETALAGCTDKINVKVQPVVKRDWISNWNVPEEFLTHKDTLVIDVEVKEGELADFYTILKSCGEPAIMLNTKTKVLGVARRMVLEEGKIDMLVEELCKFPIKLNKDFFVKLKEQAQMKEGVVSNVPSFSGIASFFMRTFEKDKSNEDQT